jgi:hypothetical protein
MGGEADGDVVSEAVLPWFRQGFDHALGLQVLQRLFVVL